jgi:hypothetical protein
MNVRYSKICRIKHSLFSIFFFLSFVLLIGCQPIGRNARKSSQNSETVNAAAPKTIEEFLNACEIPSSDLVPFEISLPDDIVLTGDERLFAWGKEELLEGESLRFTYILNIEVLPAVDIIKSGFEEEGWTVEEDGIEISGSRFHSVTATKNERKFEYQFMKLNDFAPTFTVSITCDGVCEFNNQRVLNIPLGPVPEGFVISAFSVGLGQNAGLGIDDFECQFASYDLTMEKYLPWHEGNENYIETANSHPDPDPNTHPLSEFVSMAGLEYREHIQETYLDSNWSWNRYDIFGVPSEYVFINAGETTLDYFKFYYTDTWINADFSDPAQAPSLTIYLAYEQAQLPGPAQ